MKTIFFLLNCLLVQFSFAQLNINKYDIFIDAGMVYGIKENIVKNSDFRLRHYPSLQSSIGFRFSNKKDKQFFQLQAGYTTAVSSISKNNKTIQLISSSIFNEARGPLNSTSHMVSIKMAYLNKFKQIQKNNFTLKLMVGIGLNYIINFDGNEYYFEGRTPETQEYFLSFKLNTKTTLANTNNVKTVIRVPSVQGIIATQISKKNTPFAIELYYSPAITAVIKSTYLLSYNYAIISKGNANQMQNGLGIKFLYQPKIHQR